MTPDIQQKEAEIFALGGDFDRALEISTKAYDPDSDDYRDHVWHGQVLKLLARRAKREGHQDKLPAIARQAEESLRQASKSPPMRRSPAWSWSSCW